MLSCIKIHLLLKCAMLSKVENELHNLDSLLQDLWLKAFVNAGTHIQYMLWTGVGLGFVSSHLKLIQFG